MRDGVRFVHVRAVLCSQSLSPFSCVHITCGHHAVAAKHSAYRLFAAFCRFITLETFYHRTGPSTIEQSQDSCGGAKRNTFVE